MCLLIRNATIVTMNPNRDVIKGDILIEKQHIKKIISRGRKILSDTNKNKRLLSHYTKIIDATDKIVLPGFIQTHIHLCQTLFRNMAEDVELLDWLQKYIWPSEASHSRDSLYYSALLGCAELIKGGTTTILDMGTVHYTDSVFEAVKESGLRGFIGKVMMDKKSKNIPDKLQDTTANSITESIKLYEKWHNKEDGRIKYAFAPRFVLSCSETLLERIRDLAIKNDLIIHSHSSENRSELALVMKRTGYRNLEYFDKIGLTGKNLVLAHCIWLDENEIEILKRTKTNVVHCPSSNLKLGSGIANIPEMLRQKINVGLGADGAPCNNNLSMFMEMRLSGLIQKPFYGPKAISSQQILEMATINGAKALGIRDELGCIEEGKKADMIILNINKAQTTPFAMNNIYSSIVYSMNSENVETVIIDGKIVMEDGELKMINEKEIIKKSKKYASKIWKNVL